MTNMEKLLEIAKANEQRKHTESQKEALTRDYIYNRALERVLNYLNDDTNEPPIICAWELYHRLEKLLEKKGAL